ncbi:hypothetical protein NDGK_03133 [Clostridiales bacterium CHKCI001]|nr:hypothetical protein NDGK_03133 [Clostridiales bacterium CHKCI001]
MNIKNSICFRIENLKNRVSENRATYRAFKHRDEIILSDFSRKTKRNCVNLHYWKPKDRNENLGDYLSKIVVSNFVDLDAEYEVEGGE